MKGNKKWVAAAYAAAFTAAFSMNAYADGHWEQNASGYWWQEDNGTYLKNGWKWLDGNRDGVAECYYFDANGYMVACYSGRAVCSRCQWSLECKRRCADKGGTENR